MAKLQDDDNHVRFTRFRNLPPELPVQVYGYYVAYLPQVLETPAQPRLLAHAGCYARRFLLCPTAV